MIKLEAVHIVREKAELIRDFSYCFMPGKKYVLVGQNGAGKSSLIRGITGQWPIARGRLQWQGQDLHAGALRDLALRRAVLSQHMAVNFPISACQLVEMGSYASPKPLLKRDVKRLVDEALERVRMQDFAGRDYRSLSGGEQKRVQLAKCLVQLRVTESDERAQWLILDEPNAGLDLSEQYKLAGTINELVLEKNYGVIAVLHDLNLAALMADEILYLKGGRLHHAGPAARMLEPSIIREVLDLPADIPLPIPDRTQFLSRLLHV